jgi:hypothetical protein
MMSEYDATLATAQADAFDEEEEEYREDHFRVVDDQAAEWCLEKIRQADQRLAKWAEHCKGLMEKEQRRHDATVDRMKYYLRQYLATCQADGMAKETKTKTSYKLPSGTLTLKKGTWKYSQDEKTLCDWLHSHGLPQYIQTKEKPMWGELKKGTTLLADGTVVLESTGEVIEGVTAEMGQDEFTVD